MKLMYRKHVQTTPTKTGIWLQEFVSIAFSKWYMLGITADPTKLPINIPGDHSLRNRAVLFL